MARILEGDCLRVIAGLPSMSADVCVTDPPYGLKFMGKAWDHGVPGAPYWAAVLGVLKPGGHLLAFGGTRTYHRLTCAIEDAGWEIRDCLMWLHGQGFPKGKSQMKPAWEPIILARAPGKGPGLQIDACRIGTDSTQRPMGKLTSKGLPGGGFGAPERRGDRPIVGLGGSESGRWPANVVFSHEDGCREVGTVEVPSRGGAIRTNYLGRLNDDGWVAKDQVIKRPSPTVAAWECVETCAVRLLDEQSGERGKSDGVWRTSPNTAIYGQGLQSCPPGQDGQRIGFGDRGGASRFFYCAKASPAERRPYNDHPTVKPLALMRWLIRLVTPPGGTVLDPFCGSGSTLVAASREGFDSIGIDRDPHAVEIARRRIAEDAPLFQEVAQ